MKTLSFPKVQREPTRILLNLRERIWAYEDETKPWARGCIATEVWRDHPEMPLVMKKAEVIARCFERIPGTVLPEDRFAGFVFRRLRLHQGVSDEDAWRNRAKHPEFFGYDESAPLPPEVRKTYQWWQGQKGLEGLNKFNMRRKKNPWLSKYGICFPVGLVGGHTLPDHGILLQSGISGLRKQIVLSQKKARSQEVYIQLCAMDRILKGLQCHCLVSAQVAENTAKTCKDMSLVESLMKTATDCRALAQQPPATLAQALQLLFFSNCADLLDTPGDATSFGRIDQYLFPFLEHELAQGTLDLEEAFNLVCQFLAKKWCRQTSNNMCVGGLTPEGTDGTNELSYLFLEAMETTHIDFALHVRVHCASPDRLLEAAARVQRCGFGRSGIYSDKVSIDAIVKKGVCLEDARDYAPLGCAEVMIPGRTPYRTMGLGLNAVKVLELVINRGHCLRTGDKIFDNVPEIYNTFEALMVEYEKRVRKVIAVSMKIIREDERLESIYFPRPWLTVLSHGGIEDGVDMTGGQPKYNPVAVTHIGLADISNSLLAIRRLVYEQKRLDFSELRILLKDNWKNHEDLRRIVVERFARFGQGNADIQAIAQREAQHFADCFVHERTYFNDRFWPMIFGVSTNVVYNLGPKTGATVSGRREQDTLAHTLEPSTQGARGGMTEILADCTAVDLSEFPGGISNVQDCESTFVNGKLARVVDLLRGYMKAGGTELSLNFLSKEQLLDAQANPESYPNLLVRLFGLSARFVNLSPEMQQTVIDRIVAANPKARTTSIHL